MVFDITKVTVVVVSSAVISRNIKLPATEAKNQCVLTTFSTINIYFSFVYLLGLIITSIEVSNTILVI